MAEIPEDQVEWATVHRMREMLPADNAPYKLTQAFALFTGILSWTLQRIRTKHDPEDLAWPRMNKLCEELSAEAFRDFVLLPTRPVQATSFGAGPQVTPLPFNDFSQFSEGGTPFNALRTLEALRNAVAHGDARSIRPINSYNQLVRFRLRCQEQKTGWAGNVALDRTGVSTIAQAVADRFCDALSGGSYEYEHHAEALRD